MTARPLYALLSVLLAAAGQLCAQTISQQEFLDRLMEIHPTIQKERLTADVAREEQNSYAGQQDWLLSSRVGFSHEQPAISFAGPERTNTLSLSAGAERTFWSTGGRFNATFATSSASILPTFGFSMPFYQNQVAVSYVQPLLRNIWGSLDRLPFDLKQFDIDAAEVEASENIEAFLTGSAKLFLSWIFLTEQEKIIAERLRLSEEERARTEEKRRANLVDQADVIRAEDAVRAWKQHQVLVHSQWKAVRAQLAVLARDERLHSMAPGNDLYEIPALEPLEEAQSRLLSQSRVLSILDVRRNQLLAGREGFQETMKPDLSVYAALSTKRLDESAGKSLMMDKPDANIGIRFTVPMGNRTARAQVARTDVQLLQLERQRAEAALTLTAVLTNLHIQLGELANVLALNREQIESARQRTQEELKLYNQGRGDLTFVILSRDNEQNAKQTYAQNAYSYHALLIDYRALLDDLYAGEVK